MKSGFNTIIPLENGKAVAANWCTNECLSHVLKEVEKRRRLNDLIIHHDNASAHKAIQTMEYLEAHRVKLMGHPVYSPDLSHCYFWLFTKIKEQLRGKVSRISMNFMLLFRNKRTVTEKKTSTNIMNSGSKE
ncbi:unnamed protein product [Rotaria socialis]|uniref:Transposase n=1 Tax=Rotaria socialis TaxID=392032 RepID=A0A818NE14_9BILA|nr:unnamed protein product [Rotaria socialis]CAF3480561.1 unnamed protein product [Rotaria socialis]CAF3603726.1 unnamed protein product [Rotaria socialis]CAF4288015.1 unnamed protein product [Rotaria socialis]CAF4310419.1 unnamed protein product [Rotaria socialis]